MHFLWKSERGLIYQKCQEKFGKGAYTLNIKDAGEWDYLKAQLSANHGCTGCSMLLQFSDSMCSN